jgi:Tfp pilus assembly protein PilV
MAVEATGKVASSAIEAMKSTPLAIALLIVNVGFLGFAAYILGEVASNAKERNNAQLELISKLVTDIRDCRQVPKSELFQYFDRAGGRS